MSSSGITTQPLKDFNGVLDFPLHFVLVLGNSSACSLVVICCVNSASRPARGSHFKTLDDGTSCRSRLLLFARRFILFTCVCPIFPKQKKVSFLALLSFSSFFPFLVFFFVRKRESTLNFFLTSFVVSWQKVSAHIPFFPFPSFPSFFFL